MFIDKRRAKRVETDIPIKILLRNDLKNKEVVGPTAGRLHNISGNGAGISISNIHFGKYHLVYSAQDEETPRTLFVEFSSGVPEEKFRLPVKPAWFDTYHHEDGSIRFRIGLRFLTPPNSETVDFFNKSGLGNTRRQWWTHLLNRLQKTFQVPITCLKAHGADATRP